MDDQTRLDLRENAAASAKSTPSPIFEAKCPLAGNYYFQHFQPRREKTDAVAAAPGVATPWGRVRA